MNRTELRAAFAAAARITRGAGALARSWFERADRIPVEEKGPQDFVTEADRAVERFLLERLHLVHRHARVLAEETSPTWRDTGEPVWLVDPIDGTGNFIRGLPLFCTSVALWDDGQVRFGLIYDPVRDEMFEALEGEGAFVNGRAMQASATSEPERAAIAVGRSLRTEQTGVAGSLYRAFEAGFAVRMLGSAALASAWVAAGRFDAFFEQSLRPWDVGAAIRIAAEAGCVCDYQLGAKEMRGGTPFLVSSPGIVDVVRRVSGLSRGAPPAEASPPSG